MSPRQLPTRPTSVRDRRPIPITASTRGHLTGDRRWMPTNTTPEHRPRHPRSTISPALISSRSSNDNGKTGISNGRWWSSAPAIMTGTVHRPLELAHVPAFQTSKWSTLVAVTSYKGSPGERRATPGSRSTAQNVRRDRRLTFASAFGSARGTGDLCAVCLPRGAGVRRSEWCPTRR